MDLHFFCPHRVVGSREGLWGVCVSTRTGLPAPAWPWQCPLCWGRCCSGGHRGSSVLPGTPRGVLGISGMMFEHPQRQWGPCCPGVTPDADSQLLGWAPNPGTAKAGSRAGTEGVNVAFEQGMGAQNCSSDVAGAAQLEPRTPLRDRSQLLDTN